MSSFFKTAWMVRVLTLRAPFFLLMFFGGCATISKPLPPLQMVPHVDIERFMGPWYVIGCIPTFIERNAVNSVESYALNSDGSIATTFTFNQGSFEGKQKKYTPRGFILEYDSNARWGMRFIWPFKADYRIAYLNSDYTLTVIARQKRDYVWIMAREPVISDEDYERLIQFVSSQGYDTAKIQRVLQQVR